MNNLFSVGYLMQEKELPTKIYLYRNYLDRICDIGEKCGFSVQEDKLRIPSTKRICFIGIHDSQKSIDNNLLQELDKNFVPRPSEELVRI